MPRCKRAIDYQSAGLSCRSNYQYLHLPVLCVAWMTGEAAYVARIVVSHKSGSKRLDPPSVVRR